LESIQLSDCENKIKFQYKSCPAWLSSTNALDFITKGLQHPENDYISPDLSDKVIAKTKMLGAGEKDSVTFKVPEKKGVYEYVCTFRAHYQAGMKGKLIVE